MNYTENIREGLKSINANRLRTVLTALIIAIGITSLVGILTAIDGIKASVDDSFSSLGVNTFSIRTIRNQGGRRRGVEQKRYPPISYKEANRFLDNYKFPSIPSINTTVTEIAEVKYGSKVTNPNSTVKGVDGNYLLVEGYDLEVGRNFTPVEGQNASHVVIIGNEIAENLFGRVNAVNQSITVLGGKLRVIGVLKEQGGVGGANGADRIIMLPLETARKFSRGRDLRYTISVSVSDPAKIDVAMGEALGLMRAIRRDPLEESESFEVSKSNSLVERLGQITGYLRVGGFSIGFITLLGASIGLMNIMMVTVTERTREIGIRKAMGATPKKIRQQFLAEAIVITQIGGFGGIVLGIGVGNLVSSMLSSGSFIIPWEWILLGLAVGMVVGLVSGYIPAHRASKLDPIASLRYE